ncbi:WD repeat and HMG-box DNA-binding protein 1 [Culicoides brevitarsis]|uniref:WD repeat and HMG-box DNA-binding protein 1 n=1 Tax=Culicoides brevitarsis TaxID=469753 RepID=UPI00307B6185
MGFKRYISRYAHCGGYTHCCYSEDGEKILTCGKDGDIRIWSGKDDDDASSNGISEYVNCVVQYENRILVATDMNIVSAYTFPECKKDGIEFRFSASATTIQVNDAWIVAGAEDFMLKVVKKDKSEDAFELKGHEGPIVYAELGPNNFLASKSGDGKIKIWDLTKQKDVHTISGLDKCKTFDTALSYGALSFDAKKYFAYCYQRKIVVLNTADWTEAFSLEDANASGEFTVCSFSPSGKLIAAGTSKGELVIFSVVTKKSIGGDVKPSEMNALTAIAWNPHQDKFNGELSICDASGQIEFITEAFDETSGGAEEKKSVSKPQKKTSRPPSAMDDDDDGADDIYKEYGFEDAEAMDDERDIMGLEEDEDGVSLERIKNETLNKYGSQESLSMKSNVAASVKDLPMARTVDLQPVFQPGSTPASLEHRFMIWNHVGIVRSHKSDDEDSIEVEFHDSSTHHGIHINNHLNHTMASLSTSVLALACEAPSKLVCITLKVAGSREWSISMPDTEEIQAVCASDKLVAVATDARYLRIFTVLGTQREVLCIPGQIVALAAHDEQIIVAYHAAAAATDDQNMNLMIIDSFGYNIKCKEAKIPLTPGSKLTWLGFSREGSPVIYDSRGIMKLYRHKSSCWFPIWNGAENTRGASDTFFIVSVTEELKEIQAILCRGCPYPLTVPRPICGIFKTEMPLCDLDLEKSRIEEELLSCKILQVLNAQKTIKEDAIKLFALACKSELEYRARELIELIALPEIVPIAAKYASGLGRIHLVQKLQDLMPVVEERQKEIEEKLNAPDQEMIPAGILMNNSSNNPLLSSSPVIGPGPILKPKTMNRNPFKKMNTSGSSSANIQQNSKSKAFSHLSDLGLGYSPTTETQASDLNDSFGTENGETKQKTAVMPFPEWFKQNSDKLKEEFPTENLKEFNKICMGKYTEWKKSLGSENKRKIDDVDNDSMSGVSKLAKFAKA